MTTVLGYLAGHTVLLVFLIIGIGMYFGHVKVRSVSLGAAAVLFVAIAISALGTHYGIEVKVPAAVGTLGLMVFAFAIGITSGPSFFRNIRSALLPILSVFVIYALGAGVAFGLGRYAFNLDISTIAGAFAGATTNTPALAAAGEASGNPADATVGYSITYIFGVLGALVIAALAVRAGKNDTDVPSQLMHATLRVERNDKPSVAELAEMFDGALAFSRLRRGETGPIWMPEPTDHLEKGDLLTVVGRKEHVNRIVAELGHRSSHPLDVDRRYLDYRRITVSDARVAGHTVAEIDEMIDERFGAQISRIRRGDVDHSADPEFLVEMGDRVRVVAPTHNIKKISAFFGDSTRGLSDINPVILGLGLALGAFIGELQIPTPGGSSFSIGSAAGTLIIGLILGRLGRIGRMSTTLPYSSSQVLSELGLLLFLAQAGTNAGGQIAQAFTGGTWLSIVVVGAAVTMVVSCGVFVVMRGLFHMGGTKLSGFLAGVQTQPALLAFANERTNFDARVALGYALIYPAAMIGKIVVAQILGSL